MTLRRNFEQASWGARGDMSLEAGAAGALPYAGKRDAMGRPVLSDGLVRVTGQVKGRSILCSQANQPLASFVLLVSFINKHRFNRPRTSAGSAHCQLCSTSFHCVCLCVSVCIRPGTAWLAVNCSLTSPRILEQSSNEFASRQCVPARLVSRARGRERILGLGAAPSSRLVLTLGRRSQQVQRHLQFHRLCCEV